MHQLRWPNGVMTAILEVPAPAPSADVDASNRRARFSTRTWDRIGYVALLVATAVAYLWNITINGMGNQFYAGAAQAGSR